MGATALRAPRLRRPRLRIGRQRVRLGMAIGLISVLLLGGGWLLLRDSSLVAVEHVTVTGATGSEAPEIRAALKAAARKMTTLDLAMRPLRAAVSQFPEVKALRLSTQFPHGLTIHVVERLPVATVVEAYGREIAVSGDGTLLPRVSVTGSVPVMALSQPPAGGRLKGFWDLGAARLLAAAPPRMLTRLAKVGSVVGHGLVAQIRSGPSIYFGDPSHVQAKWIAALSVLADPGSAGASYIDVSDPTRPAAGAADVGSAASAAGAPTTSTGTTGTTGAAGSTGAAGTTGATAPAGAGSAGTDSTGGATGGGAASSTSGG